MAEYTPGPWYVTSGHSTDCYRYIVAGTVILAKVQPPNMEANARLMAAASDMLEVLKGLEEAVDDLNAATGTNDKPCRICRATVYNAEVGIVHEEDCPIVKARTAIDAADRGTTHG